MIPFRPGHKISSWGTILLLVGMCLAPLLARAQQQPVSLHLENVPFRVFADTVEKAGRVRLFYADPWVDSLRITLHADHQAAIQVVEQVLNQQHLSFVVRDGNNIILTPGYTVKTDFKDSYLKYVRDHTLKRDTLVYRLSTGTKPASENEKDKYRLIKIGNPALMDKGKYASLSGFVLDGNSGQPVVGAVVYVPKIRVGTTTNSEGYYVVELPKGQHVIEYRTIGMRTERRNIMMYSSGRLDMETFEEEQMLDAVTVSANRENNVQNMRIGIEKISMKMLKQIPMGLGEVDLVKSSLLLPGVQSVGEAASGYNIRGGNTDENLILLNKAPIINSSHFFGFFTAFNSDVIDDVTLYKSGVPVMYGGRTSSIMDIRLKEGSKEKVKVSGGVSPVTGRVLVEGPITDKATFILGGRSTYSNWLLRQLKDKQLQQSTAGFYDLQGLTALDLDKNNKITLSGYYSSDHFDYYKESDLQYDNLAATLDWNHIFSPGLSADFSAVLSNYGYQVKNVGDTSVMNSLEYRLYQDLLNADFTWLPKEKHKVTFGMNSTLYRLSPGKQLPLQDASVITPGTMENERALESSLYLGDEVILSPWITLSGGVRATLYAAFGPKSGYTYANGLPLTVETITDTVHYQAGEIIAAYPGLEYRLTSRFLLNYGFSLKAGIQRLSQYIHMISNTTAISPTDIWKLSDAWLKPQRSTQLSLGIYKNFNRDMYEFSVEGYYKFLSNIIDYKNGATLLMNDHLETDLINGKGKAYGVEVLLKKARGNLSGWISYTHARVFHQVNGDFDVERINGGDWFPANYDRPHDVKMVVNAKLSRRFNVTTNVMYATGRPITYPAGYFYFGNVYRLYYSDRNEFRMPDFFRVDFAATANGNLKLNKLNHSSLTLAVYNVLGRRNPYSIYFKVEDGEVKGYKLSIFGQPIITLTYNFRIFGNALGDF